MGKGNNGGNQRTTWIALLTGYDYRAYNVIILILVYYVG